MSNHQLVDLMKGSTLRNFLRWTESNAAEIRSLAGVGETEPLNPRERAAQLGVVIAPPQYFDSLPEEMRSQMLQLDAKQWSGMSRTLPDGKLLILLNPRQTPERENVTIMEEVAHAHYDHNPVSFDESGKRVYKQENEQEAYQTAAATLLPMKIVSYSVWRNRPVEELAQEYGVSVDLVEMRIKLLGMWHQYKK